MASNDYCVFKIFVVCFSICPFCWLSLSLFVLDILTAFSTLNFLCVKIKEMCSICVGEKVWTLGVAVFS